MIDEARPSDSGTYLCIASNLAGNTSNDIQFTVYGE